MKTNYHSEIVRQAGLTPEEAEQPEQKEESSAVSANRVLKIQWLNDTVTKELFRAIDYSIADYENRARLLAINYNQEQKHLEIINLLVRAQELRNLKNNYHVNRSE